MLINIKKASEMLGVSRSTFYRRISNPIDSLNDYIEIVLEKGTIKIIKDSLIRYIQNKIRINRI